MVNHVLPTPNLASTAKKSGWLARRAARRRAEQEGMEYLTRWHQRFIALYLPGPLCRVDDGSGDRVVSLWWVGADRVRAAPLVAASARMVFCESK